MSPHGKSAVDRDAVDLRGGAEGAELHLVRDLLDKQLIDRHEEPMGRADGLVLTVTDGRQPYLAFVESGTTAAAERLHRRLGRWARAAARRWGLRRGKPVRIPWARVVKVGIETELDVDAGETGALVWEHWLLRHVVGRIPSLKPRNKEKEKEKNKDEEKKDKEK